jgi:predicted Zn-dependent protease
MNAKGRSLQFALLMVSLVTGWMLGCGSPARGQEMDRELDTVEMNVLGQKFPNLSPEERLQLLERQTGTTPPPKASYEYRVSQVFNAQQDAVDADDRHAAIRLYNRAIDEVARGETDAAMKDCTDALKLDPYLIPAYNNLANLQEKKQQYDAAIATYHQALAMTPKEALLHFNLAVILEKVGKIPEAYDEYHQYVQLSDNPNPQIVSLLRSYDIKRNSGRNETDYVPLTTQESEGTPLIWPSWQIPIPIYINITDPSQVAFVENVHRDLETWSQVTGNYLRFREVGTPDQARILLTLKRGPLMDPSSSIGHASFDMMLLNSDDPMRNLKVTIAVNTGEPNSDLPLVHRKEQVGKLVLHELGHAIGIWGHSSDPGDIMYTHPIVATLSQRDINTIRKIYGLK